MHNMGFGLGGGFEPSTAFLPLLLLLLLWGIFWKGLALWHASKRDDKWWFLALLVINTAGILEIVYLFAYAKLKWHEVVSVFKK